MILGLVIRPVFIVTTYWTADDKGPCGLKGAQMGLISRKQKKGEN
jgi:hypothetical protein